MTAKEDHEDAAIGALCDELTARGLETRIVAHPDRDKNHPLTVDAVISIAGDEWAVDHCLLSRPSLLPAAMKATEKALGIEIEKIAKEHGRMIVVSYLPQTGAHGQKWGADYYRGLRELAVKAAVIDGLVAGDDGFATAQSFHSDTPTAVLTPFTDTTGNASIAAQIAAGLRDPLVKKLDGQLKQAKQAGFRTALLLDQVPRGGSESHTVWLAGPTTVAAVTTSILNEHRRENPPVLDQVWLRPGQRITSAIAPSVHLLIS
ncbi:hypothetical protein [Streptomyces sp. NPDC001787]|uniref:hypothetical protein n=1 Tax=Streptomyces sp. NPDC001787 TaxID=3154523 RepID=UPI003323A6F4